MDSLGCSSRSHRKSKSGSLFLSPRNVIKLSPANFKSLESLWKDNKDQKCIKAFFGRFSLREILHKSYLTIGVPDNDENLVGVMVLGVHPNIPVISPGDWEEWIIKMYGLPQVNSYNSLWIRLLIWHPVYYCLFMKPLVQYLFTSITELKHLLMIIPPIDYPTDFLDGTGFKIRPRGLGGKTQSIYLVVRERFLPVYKIRGGVEEDNDDIVQLIERYTNKLSEHYDKYYIAELLTKFIDKTRRIIVAEYKNKLVGVLILNDIVNYQLLLTEFEIGPFNGLKKPHPDDMENFISDEIVLCSASTEQFFQAMDVEDLHDFLVKKSVANEKNQECEVIYNITQTESDDYSLVFTSSALYLFHDEDEGTEIQESIDQQESTSTLLIDLFDNPQYKKRYSSIATQEVRKATVQIEARGRTHDPDFEGEPNAFTLEVVALDPDHEECLKKLLESGFDCFPDKEYCVMTLPSYAEEGNLKHFFTNVPPKFDGVFPQNLYLMHRNAVLGSVHVEEISSKYRAQVKNLLSTIPNSTTLWQQLDFVMQENSAPVYCYIMLCEKTVIGVAFLIEEFDFAYLRNHYDLYPMNFKCFKSGSIGLVENIVVSPIFQRLAHFFVRELHRHSEFDALFYKLKPTENSAMYRERPLNTVLDRFLPMMPLKLPEVDMKSLKTGGYNIEESILQESDIFSLYLSTLPTCSMTTFTIKKKIVVVGNSTTALSFVKSLIFCKNLHYHVNYNNITLISNQGFYPGKISNKIRESFVIKKHFFDGKYLDALNLRTFMNSVIGKITEIRRKDKVVIVNDEVFLPYDLLFLMTGEIFQKPEKLSSFSHKPQNLYMINNALDASNALKKLKSLIARPDLYNFKIIVYGHYLQAHVTLGGLLSFGIPGGNIVFIEPFPYPQVLGRRHRHNVSVFNDPDIESAIYTHILQQGVELRSSYYFIDLVYDPEENLVISARFESRHKMLNVNCLAMFYFGKRAVQPRVANVLQTAGLVYDGKLVIDKDYRTNDPNIYAAGTLTKYSRRYHANQYSHKYFNRSEVGKHLAEAIKEMLLPDEFQKTEIKPLGWNFYLDRGKNLTPKYEKPVMRYCKLPGELYYLSVVRPGRSIPLQTALSMENYGEVFITGSTKRLDEQGYFRLHINKNERVETITCLTKFPLDIQNLYNLWGKNESLLNHLGIRFQMVLIKDLFHFFREPWSMILFHPKFGDVMNYCNMVTTSIVGREGESIVHKLIRKMKSNKWKPLTEEEHIELAKDFKRLNYKDIIEQKVLEFIEENIDQLAVYAHPKIIMSLLKGYETSHLFH